MDRTSFTGKRSLIFRNVTCAISPVRSMLSWTAAIIQTGLLPASSPINCKVRASSFNARASVFDLKNSESSSIISTKPSNPASFTAINALSNVSCLSSTRASGALMPRLFIKLMPFV